MIHNTREHLESIQSSLYQIAQSRIRGGSARGDRTRDHWHHVDRLPTTFTAPRRSARPWSIARCLLILRSSIRSSTPRNASIHASCTTLIRRPAHRGSRITMITDRRRSHARKTHRSVLLFPPWSNAGIPREAPVDARAESGPRIRSRQWANSGEKNILGTRRQPVNQPDYAARGTRRITCRSRGNRQRIELSGRTIPFQISFTTIHLSYISTECPPAPSYNRYITRHVALKREKKRGRRSRGRRGKRESIDVVGSLHRFTSA